LSAYPYLTRVLVEKYEVDEALLRPEATVAELGLDSLMLVEFVFDVEDEFEIEISEDDAAFGTLGEAAELIDRLLREKRG
jgi:acyl carrier protein